MCGVITMANGNLNRLETRMGLVKRQNSIVFEHSEDMCAAEHHAEIQSVIDVIDRAGSDDEIRKAAEWVGLSEVLS